MSDNRQKKEDFNKRWEITSEGNYAKEFVKFKNRIKNILLNVDDHATEEGIIHFCNLIGDKEVEWKYHSQGKYSTNIIDIFRAEDDEKEFYHLIEYLFLVNFQNTNSFEHNFSSHKENYYSKIKEIIEYSTVNVSITKNGDDVILFPKGESLLEEKLVDEGLSFLNSESQSHFIDAIKFYEKTKSVKSAESLRRAIEEFLRYKLNNSKGLKGNILELQKRMKMDNRDPIIRNVISQVFNYLDQYFNENSKHQDGDIDDVENEYLIYQVGVLMRYINKAVRSSRELS